MRHFQCSHIAHFGSFSLIAVQFFTVSLFLLFLRTHFRVHEKGCHWAFVTLLYCLSLSFILLYLLFFEEKMATVLLTTTLTHDHFLSFIFSSSRGSYSISSIRKALPIFLYHFTMALCSLHNTFRGVPYTLITFTVLYTFICLHVL